MSLAGEGAVAIWHDLEPQGREEFYAWHGEEHMPERVGIPGFVRGRRYVALNSGQANVEGEFFNLYEALSPQVVAGNDYLNRLNNPTPWTQSTVKYFRNVARSICQVAASTGHGCGGLIATWRYDVAQDEFAKHKVIMQQQVIPQLASHRGVAGVHLLIADIDASSVKTEEQRVRTGTNQIPAWILLLEGWGDEIDFKPLCMDVLQVQDKLQSSGAKTAMKSGFYKLQSTRLKTAWSAG